MYWTVLKKPLTNNRVSKERTLLITNCLQRQTAKEEKVNHMHCADLNSWPAVLQFDKENVYTVLEWIFNPTFQYNCPISAPAFQQKWAKMWYANKASQSKRQVLLCHIQKHSHFRACKHGTSCLILLKLSVLKIHTGALAHSSYSFTESKSTWVVKYFCYCQKKYCVNYR